MRSLISLLVIAKDTLIIGGIGLIFGTVIWGLEFMILMVAYGAGHPFVVAMYSVHGWAMVAIAAGLAVLFSMTLIDDGED